MQFADIEQHIGATHGLDFPRFHQQVFIIHPRRQSPADSEDAGIVVSFDFNDHLFLSWSF